MLFDNYFANILLNRKIPVNTVRLILRAVYLLICFSLFLSVFYNAANPIPNSIIFITVTGVFEIMRTRQLERYLKERK
jgi:hypothetical protein